MVGSPTAILLMPGEVNAFVSPTGTLTIVPSVSIAPLSMASDGPAHAPIRSRPASPSAGPRFACFLLRVSSFDGLWRPPSRRQLERLGRLVVVEHVAEARPSHEGL